MAPSPALQDLIDSVRADAGGDDPLDQLVQASRTVAELGRLSDALLGHYVDQCRRRGHSWSEISRALGVSKQAVHKRFSPGPPTFERFTERARAVLAGAAVEARRLGHRSVGTEHLLLALFDPPDSVAARVLAALGLTRSETEERVRARTSRAAGSPRSALPAEPTFTGRAKEALRAAVEEALGLGHTDVGTEHLLLGVSRQGGGAAAGVLASLGTTGDDVRVRTLAVISSMTEYGPHAHDLDRR
jgi:hypothetical protein